MSDPDKPTRYKLFQELVVKKQVKVKCGEEFKNGIEETLQEILGVSKVDLSEAETRKFNLEANEFYSYVPQCLKKAGRVKKRMLSRFKDYFDKVISLQSVQVCWLCILFSLQCTTAMFTEPMVMDVEFSIYKSIVFNVKTMNTFPLIFD